MYILYYFGIVLKLISFLIFKEVKLNYILFIYELNIF